jgi:uncharacterized integral membrane protein (TIGR00697 family)
MSNFPELIVTTLNTLRPEYIWPIMMLAAYGGIVLMVRFFGAAGLYAFIPLAIVAANIQVLKSVKFSVFDSPVALGTILFSATYLANDVLNELYGRAAARKAIWLAFFSYFLFSIFMIINLGYAPLTAEQAGQDMAWNLPYQDYMKAIFLPAPAFFIASMCAFIVSQLGDITIYSWIRGKTGDKHLWLRTNVSTLISALVDSIVFSVLAWKVFKAGGDMTWDTVIFTYILGTYALRVVVSIIDTPFMYLARYVGKKSADAV